LFRTAWEIAIGKAAEAVSITTWNDYSEGSEVRPSLATQSGFSDLAAYFISYFKRGVPPRIVRDAIYYFHRIEAPREPGIGIGQSRKLALRGTALPSNLVEAVALLKEPGDVLIRSSEGTRHEVQPMGLSSLTVPLTPGRPSFGLSRRGRDLLSFESAFEIRSSMSCEDFLYHAGSSIDRLRGA
jgi:hypothetical protein